MTEAPTLKLVAFGQSGFFEGHTFAMHAGPDGKIVSWRIDGREISEAEFKETLDRAGMVLNEGMFSLS